MGRSGGGGGMEEGKISVKSFNTLLMLSGNSLVCLLSTSGLSYTAKQDPTFLANLASYLGETNLTLESLSSKE